MLGPLMVSNRPSGNVRPASDFALFVQNGQSHSFRIVSPGETKERTGWTPVDRAPTLASGNRKLIILHAFYEDEAAAIFEKLASFTDYDVILTTSVAAIRDRFLRLFDPGKAACFFVANAGRDVLPMLLLLAFQDLSAYAHFVKVHTKRSRHLPDGSNWFSTNIEVLIGDKRMTDGLLERIDPTRPGIYGVECRPLRDHFWSNRRWMKSLLPLPPRQCAGCFVPGTMFAGSAEFLRRLAKLNLHLQRFEPERGQLDGCLIHALERYFGYFAREAGGECDTFESLIARSDSREAPSAFPNSPRSL
jgi:lipopolysaccharide biosynthesis protein